MKNYSFSNIPYRHSELKAAQANLRIEEIKKKYDTPSRREKISSLNKSRDNCIANKLSTKEENQENAVYCKEGTLGRQGVGKDKLARESYFNQAPPSFGGNPLKESFAINRLEKSGLKNDLYSKELECIRSNESIGLRSKEERENNVAMSRPQMREDEEVIFSKVRQMKESIINNDYMRSSTNPRSSASPSYSIGESKKFGRQFDPRVENIDKINAKIKQILCCLAEGQKKPSKFINDTQPCPTLKQSSLDLKATQNTKGSCLVGERLTIKQQSTKQSNFFNKKVAETPENVCKNTQQKTDNLLFQFKKVEEPLPLQNGFKENVSNLEKGQFGQTKDETQKSFNNPSPKIQRPAFREYRDYSASKIDSYSLNRGLSSKGQQLIKTPTYIQSKNFEGKSGLGNSQSRSNIDSTRKSTLTVNGNSDVLKSGKKLNDEISKIQKKIEEFQAQKKKMNIEFTPFSMKNRSSSNLAAGAARFQASTPEKAEVMNKSKLEARSQVRGPSMVKDSKFGENKSGQREKVEIAREKEGQRKERANGGIYGEQSKLQAKECNFQLRLQQVDVKAVRLDKSIEIKEENRVGSSSQDTAVLEAASSSFDEVAFRKRADEGIEQRKKKLRDADEVIKADSFKKLVGLFCEQAKLDQVFRNMKIWLQSDFSKDKYGKICRVLSQQGVAMTLGECELLFRVQQSEHNPFFSYQGFEGSMEAVCKAYIAAKQHWQAKIKNRFDGQNLTSEGFTVSKIDLERKGFIELQDLVRLLNIQSGTFYRNRDIFLIFRRFTKAERVTFQQVLRQLSF